MVTVVDCPTCGNKVEWTETNKVRPFCSDRCKQIDLGAWAEEKYVIRGKSDQEHMDQSDDDDNNP